MRRETPQDCERLLERFGVWAASSVAARASTGLRRGAPNCPTNCSDVAHRTSTERTVARVVFLTPIATVLGALILVLLLSPHFHSPPERFYETAVLVQPVLLVGFAVEQAGGAFRAWTESEAFIYKCYVVALLLAGQLVSTLVLAGPVGTTETHAIAIVTIGLVGGFVAVAATAFLPRAGENSDRESLDKSAQETSSSSGPA